MNKKIVIVNNGLSGGGIEKASSSMANAFAERGYDVNVIALYKRERFFTLNEGVDFWEPTFKSRNRYLYAILMVLYLRKMMKRLKPEVVLAFGEWTNPYVVIATIFTRIPLFLSDRMSPTLSLGILQNLIKTFTYPFAKGVIAQTNYAKEIIVARTKNKNVVVIPNPVNVIEQIDCQRKNQIVTVGRLTKEKGHHVLIDAFSKISNKEWLLLIVGDGAERNRLEMQVRQLGLSDRVTFVGHQKNLSVYLSESKLFVLPSLSEGFPNALIEAMSVPLPCISSDCIAGPRDIIVNGKNGILVEANNSDALANSIERLVNDEFLRENLTRNAYEIRQKLNMNNIAQRYIDFLMK